MANATHKKPYAARVITRKPSGYDPALKQRIMHTPLEML